MAKEQKRPKSPSTRPAPPGQGKGRKPVRPPKGGGKK
jgi:hypothetical protein